MPYSSDAQRRFFHSEGARKAGITPAMVREWDGASRGKPLPEKVGAFLAGVLKAAAGTASSSVSISTPSLSASTNATRPTTAAPPKLEGPKPTPFPGDYKPSFLDASGLAAQRGSDDKLRAGEALTMPVVA